MPRPLRGRPRADAKRIVPWPTRTPVQATLARVIRIVDHGRPTSVRHARTACPRLRNRLC
ncbi:hypothetical protein LUTEI9C_50261 [Luteimonas sp. 9C]|nr:hypothetical protein LUTEI9C_50261 [Luteimonas sp. 9C]